MFIINVQPPLGNNPNQPTNYTNTNFFVAGLNGRIDVTQQMLYVRQWVLQNIIRANLQAGNPILTALSGGGHTLFTGLPGRLFQAGARGYYYNSGTDDQNRYVPPMYVAQGGNMAIQRLIAYDQRPQYARTGGAVQRMNMQNQAIQELDLTDTGRTTQDGRRIYSRRGFNGDYIARRDGGIEFGNENGGSHVSGVRLGRQIYYASAIDGQSGGRWFHWGTDVPPPPTPSFQDPLRSSISDFPDLIIRSGD